jgi:methylmalonyl-CoA mutase N-terminal domain/subunit
VEDVKARRDRARVEATLGSLKVAARGSENLMDPLLEAARAYATLGEMCDALREVWGEYEEVPVF